MARAPRCEPLPIAIGGGLAGRRADGSVALRRHPDWIRARMPSGDNYHDLKGLLRGLDLNTVCEEAHCPNIGECWDQRTATIMILGDTCTRACGFCAVKTGRPTWFDDDEPRRVAEAVAVMHPGARRRHERRPRRPPDGGSRIFAETITQMRDRSPGHGHRGPHPRLRRLGRPAAHVHGRPPDILNHNLETVKRLRSRSASAPAGIARCTSCAGPRRWPAEAATRSTTKSSLMVGLGETRDELQEAFEALRANDVDILTIGQYLRPSLQHLPLERYYHPDEFAEMKTAALALGFKHVESAPLVRSSYHARDQVPGRAQAVRRRRATLDDTEGGRPPLG